MGKVYLVPQFLNFHFDIIDIDKYYKILLCITRAWGNHLGTFYRKVSHKNVWCENGNEKKSEGTLVLVTKMSLLPLDLFVIDLNAKRQKLASWIKWTEGERELTRRI